MLSITPRFVFLTYHTIKVNPAQEPNLQARSLWNITPSIVEEYLKAKTHHEEPTTNIDLLLPSPMPDSASPKSEEAFGPRALRVQPQTPSKRHGMTASPASDSWPSDSPRPWILSPQSDAGSPRSSIYSVLRDTLGRVSPANGKRYMRGRTLRRRSGDSTCASLSETNNQTRSQSPTKSWRQTKLRTPNLDTRALHTSGPESDGDKQHATDMRSPELSENILTAKPLDSAIPSATTITKSIDPTSSALPTRRPPPMRRRMSLPHTGYRLSVEVEKRRQLADEEREQFEYEMRAQYATCSFLGIYHTYSPPIRLLDEATKQNNIMRQQLQRIAAEFRDFAHVQKQLIDLLNMPFPTVSQEVFDAISHDPAAMTGQTRRLKGWRAVEEVHCRITRQQDILSSFAATLTDLNNRLPRPRGIFDESLDGLMSSVSRLEHHREDLRKKRDEATQKLAHVRELHVLTKMEFNDTLGYTSQIYPEVFVTVSPRRGGLS